MLLGSINLSSQPGHQAAFWPLNTDLKEDICNPDYFMAKRPQVLPSQQKLCGNVTLTRGRVGGSRVPLCTGG